MQTSTVQPPKGEINWNWRDQIALVVAGIFLFFPFLGSVHLFDWDEINFAECSREMLVLDDYLRVHINFLPFWEKPPLFFWLQAGAMKIFGVNEFAARFPNAICGVLTMSALYFFGTKIVDRKLGLLWVLAYVGAILPHLYFKSGIIDPVFNLLIFSSLYCLFQSLYPTRSYYEGRAARNSHLILGGFSLGLALLTKGPAALLIVGLLLGIHTIFYKNFNLARVSKLLVFSLLALLVASVWLGAETYYHGTWFLQTFIDYNLRLFNTKDAGHGGFLGYHLVVLLFGCFPMSIFAISAFRKKREASPMLSQFKIFMKILFFVVLVLFSIVSTKIIHYSSLCYFPLSFLAATALYEISNKQLTISKLQLFLFLLVGILIGLVGLSVPIVGQHIDWLAPLIAKDVFAAANLKAVVTWFNWEIIFGLLLIVATILGVVWLKKGRTYPALLSLFGGTVLFVQGVMIVFVPKIEQYSQAAAIDFFVSKKEENCYVWNYGYRSYAPYFYGQRKADLRVEANDQNWLLSGNIDKPVYVIAKINKKEELSKIENLVFQYEKNGFIFYQRKINSK